MSTNQNLFEEKGGPKPNALPLGQTGSHRNCDDDDDDEVLLYVHRNRRLIRDGSPGRPLDFTQLQSSVVVVTVSVLGIIIHSPSFHTSWPVLRQNHSGGECIVR